MRKFGLRERLGVFSKTTKRTETGRRGFLCRLLAVFGTPALLPRAVYGGPQTAQRTAAISSVPAAAAPADLLLYNGKVITLDAGSRISEAVAIRGSRIIAVGETAALTAQTPPGARRIDLQGSALLPGLFDTHPHMDREGLRSLGGKSLVGANSVAAIVRSGCSGGTGRPAGGMDHLHAHGGTPVRLCQPPQHAQGRAFPKSSRFGQRSARQSGLHPQCLGLVESSAVSGSRQQRGVAACRQQRRYARSLQH